MRVRARVRVSVGSSERIASTWGGLGLGLGSVVRGKGVCRVRVEE